MAITSHLLWGLLFLSTFLGFTVQDCPANTKLPKFFKSQINIAMMKADRVVPNSPSQALYYVSNYPLELINRSFSTNIDSTMSIQRMEADILKQSITFKLKKIKSQTSLLIAFEYFDSIWKNFDVCVLLFDKATYPGIVFGQISATNYEGRVQVQASAKLPAAFKQTSAKALVYLTGINCFRKSPTDFLFEISLTDKLDLTLSQISVTVRPGENIVLSEINIAYIIFSENKNYEISGSYQMFENVGSGRQYKYLGDKISSNNYFLAGISSFRFKRGPGSFYLHYKLKSNAQNSLELESNEPLSIFKLALFRIGNTAKKLCQNCPQKTVFNIVPTTSCVSTCPGSLFKDPSDQSEKCIICSSQQNFELVSGKCQCLSGFFYVNGQCLSALQSKLRTGDFKPSFSKSDADCLDPNSYKGPAGKCICKSGYQQNQFKMCESICPNGFYDGQKCVYCSTGTYPWNDLQACLPCSNDCFTCLSEYSCGKCNQGYRQNQIGKCQQICGDGQKINAECDDSNTQDGDGCSSSCRIESGFTCSYDERIGRSVCASIDYTTRVKEVSFKSGNLIVDFQMQPAPKRAYTQEEIQQKIKIKFKSSPPYQNYIVHSATNLSIFRIVSTYGGNAPLAPAQIDVQIEDPNGRVYKQVVRKEFIADGRTFSKRSKQRDLLH